MSTVQRFSLLLKLIDWRYGKRENCGNGGEKEVEEEERGRGFDLKHAEVRIADNG